jgi:hypothetical protein
MIEWMSQLDLAGKIGLETILTKILIVVVDGEIRVKKVWPEFLTNRN